MIDPHRLAAFCAMSLLLSAIPGPSVLFVVGRALAHGRRVALASVFGNALGGYVLVIAVALGVGSVVARSVVVFNVIRIAGALYLILLGVQAIRGRRGSVAADRLVRVVTRRQTRRAGLVVSAARAEVRGGPWHVW
ncbi:hypothetical protein Raf01_30920 [Rugosimonospora africana]|uniref:LysE type translocator n=1 Tax=Rugosimonospora africana TaxID=556532 RepID=A0A8J3VQA1_9ACTN|nr:hypothetical protein Raf01_30920 [Rugosimonospora africana]